MAFNEPFDQDTIDERDEAPAVKRRKQCRSARMLRRAHDAFAERQLLREAGLTEKDMAND